MWARAPCALRARATHLATASAVLRGRPRRNYGSESVHGACTNIAYQGVIGAFSESATLEYFAQSSTEVTPTGFPTFVDVCESVSDGTCDAGVLPIEDSIGGTFHAVYDLLLANDLHVIGEHASRMEHVLCALPGVQRSDIRTVSSHPAILNQCEGYLQRLESHIVQVSGGQHLHRVPSLNSAESCQELSQTRQPDTAVICSPRAAEVYGLETLDVDVADSSVSTRYFVVGREPAGLEFGRRVKCSVVFSLPNEPMSIFKAISCFALRDIDIAKIESRPAPGLGLGNAGFRVSSAGKVSGSVGKAWASDMHKWDYVFYMDCELAARHGGLAAPAVMDAAVEQLSEFALNVRELGRYTQNMPSERERALRSPTTVDELIR